MTDELRVMFLRCNDVMDHFITTLSEDHEAVVEFEDPLAALDEDTKPDTSNEPAAYPSSLAQPNEFVRFERQEDLRKILVVDDEQGILDLLGETVAELGYEPVCCISGKVAVQHLIKGLRPTAALVDLSMPGMDGLELTKRILECDPTIAVVMCSGFAGKKDVASFLNLGAFGYLDKPAKHHDMTLMLQNAVRTTQIRRLSRDLGYMSLQTFRELIKLSAEILGSNIDPDVKAQIKELESQLEAIGKITRTLTAA